jgi:hypothetical protein
MNNLVDVDADVVNIVFSLARFGSLERQQFWQVLDSLPKCKSVQQKNSVEDGECGSL